MLGYAPGRLADRQDGLNPAFTHFPTCLRNSLARAPAPAALESMADKYQQSAIRPSAKAAFRLPIDFINENEEFLMHFRNI